MTLLTAVIDAALDEAAMMERGYALMSVRALKLMKTRLEKLDAYEREQHRDLADKAHGGAEGRSGAR